MTGFLDDILASRRAAGRLPKRDPSAVRDFLAAITGPGTSLIAEFKRASPSRGVIATPNVAVHAKTYASGGARAISVLTEPLFFQGCAQDLVDARAASGLPALWKDFVLDPAQVDDARSWDADAVLVIVRILGDVALRDVAGAIQGLGMTPVFEVFDERDLDRALALAPRIVGINNRDLETFQEDPGRVARLRPLIPPGVIVAGFSSISTRADVEALEQIGVDAVLVGEALMRAPDPAAKIRELLGAD